MLQNSIISLLQLSSAPVSFNHWRYFTCSSAPLSSNHGTNSVLLWQTINMMLLKDLKLRRQKHYNSCSSIISWDSLLLSSAPVSFNHWRYLHLLLSSTLIQPRLMLQWTITWCLSMPIGFVNRRIIFVFQHSIIRWSSTILLSSSLTQSPEVLIHTPAGCEIIYFHLLLSSALIQPWYKLGTAPSNYYMMPL
jgi:hypothetical protein